MGWDQRGGVRGKQSTEGSQPVEKEPPEGTKCPLEEVFGEQFLGNKSPMGRASDLEVGNRAVLFHRIVVSSLVWFKSENMFFHAQSQLGTLEMPSSS